MFALFEVVLGKKKKFLRKIATVTSLTCNKGKATTLPQMFFLLRYTFIHLIFCILMIHKSSETIA